MRYLLLIFFTSSLLSTALSQVEKDDDDVNTLFELRVDSIERIINRSRKDTIFYLYYTIQNISGDTLTYITNSCFYYNHYALQIELEEYDINPSGGCLFNSLSVNQLVPNGSFNGREWITNINFPKTGEFMVSLSVPLLKDNVKVYRVDGRNYVKDENYLNFIGATKVIEAQIGINGRKKKKSTAFQ